MTKPICAPIRPYILNGEKKRYAWCACGKSDKQPFCDGNHKGTDFTPIIVDNEKEGNILGVAVRLLETHLIVMVHIANCNY